jgi:hypothetical protein
LGVVAEWKGRTDRVGMTEAKALLRNVASRASRLSKLRNGAVHVDWGLEVAVRSLKVPAVPIELQNLASQEVDKKYLDEESVVKWPQAGRPEEAAFGEVAVVSATVAVAPACVVWADFAAADSDEDVVEIIELMASGEHVEDEVHLHFEEAGG